MSGMMLYEATKAHECRPPAPPAVAPGSLWQCSDCWQVWRCNPAIEGWWQRDHNPGCEVRTIDVGNGVIALVKKGALSAYAHIDARGNWCDIDGHPAPSPDDMRDPGIPERGGRFMDRPRAFWQPAIDKITGQAVMEQKVAGGKHSNGTPDTETFAEQVQTVKDARHLLDEDNEGTKTALGLIVIFVVVAAVVVCILALTGHLG